MMKKISLFVLILGLTTASFAQTCPIDYKRNNGFGTGCDALITLIFPNTVTCQQTTGYTRLHVFQDGTELPVVFTFLSADCTASKPSISYCGTGGNIPTVGVLTFSFELPDGTIFACNGPGGGPLPVVLSNFYAKRNTNNVGISWKTQTELNSKEFVLERKTSAGFIAVATIPATGAANGSTYSYFDNANNSKAISQYRLRVVDADGSISYSSISAVKGTGAASEFTIFPNPSNGNAKVTISDVSEATEVQVIDISGRVIKNVSVNSNNTVDLINLQKGMYMIRILNKTTGESVTQKLTVVN